MTNKSLLFCFELFFWCLFCYFTISISETGSFLKEAKRKPIVYVGQYVG